MASIVQNTNPVLRHVAEEVDIDAITSKKIQSIITRMKDALSEQSDGVALAAPQIGESFRIFIVAGFVFALQKGEDPHESTYEDMVCINPHIIKQSQKKEWREEGCLSVRWKYGYVQRATQATIEAYDKKGRPFTRGGSGLLAHIFQHEIDHLNGILFIDKARDIGTYSPDDLEADIL